MNDKYIAMIWISIIFSTTFLIFYYINWDKEYDSKIISINRYTYTIKLENGRCLHFINDERIKE